MSDLEVALREFAEYQGHRMIALDFDGTLAPLVPRPGDARPLPAAQLAVEQIAELPPSKRTALALVSGRMLADLVVCASPPVGAYLVGSHGSETGQVTVEGPRTSPLTLTASQESTLARLREVVKPIADRHPGVWVQTKPAAVVVHTRRAATPDDAAAATREALDVAAELDLAPMSGKEVVEIAVVPATKGDAISWLRSQALDRWGPVGRDVLVLYAGDDTTDENAFAALGPRDIGIKVGQGPTAAGLRVADPAELATVLTRLVGALRTGWSRWS